MGKIPFLYPPKFNKEDINNLKQLEDVEADGLEWLEMFEDYIYPDNLSHISNKKIGLNDDASQEFKNNQFVNTIKYYTKAFEIDSNFKETYTNRDKERNYEKNGD